MSVAFTRRETRRWLYACCSGSCRMHAAPLPRSRREQWGKQQKPLLDRPERRCLGSAVCLMPREAESKPPVTAVSSSWGTQVLAHTPAPLAPPTTLEVTEPGCFSGWLFPEGAQVHHAHSSGYQLRVQSSHRWTGQPPSLSSVSLTWLCPCSRLQEPPCTASAPQEASEGAGVLSVPSFG